MTFYGFLVLIHVLAAVSGMGPTFALPIIQSFGSTKESFLFLNKITEKVEKVAKVGSISLLVTGILLGIVNPNLFTEGWYITSIVLYFVAHYLAVGYSGKKTKKAIALLKEYTGDDVPSDVLALNKSIGAAGLSASAIAIIMVILMSAKPF